MVYYTSGGVGQVLSSLSFARRLHECPYKGNFAKPHLFSNAHAMYAKTQTADGILWNGLLWVLTARCFYSPPAFPSGKVSGAGVSFTPWVASELDV